MDKIRDESKVGKTIKIDVDKLFKDTETNEIKSEPDILENWANFKRSIEAAKRCIVITGAGISVSSGIPDFRSPDGLFEQLKRKYPKEVAKGQDLFDASLFRSPRKTQLFYNFMGELKQTVKRAECTPTHTFIKKLDQEGRLLRCYTQNIDNLEKLAGLQTSFCLNESKRKRRKSDDTLVEAGDDEVVVVDENPTSIDRELRQEEKDSQDESENKMDSIFKESHLEGKNELMKKFIGDTNAGITDNTNQSKSCTSFLEKFRKEVGEEIARCREKQEEYGDVKAKDESRSEEVEIKHEVAESQNTGDAAGTVGGSVAWEFRIC
ncbi:NAD-dependent histone deacetylase HST3 [Zancudomyces culisetae]|uniref:NAD-dependent histone deacetylase HST3 n=1 Tax=Zancudomyces culisetae TaxID=1213189 RepID=A0A1R1PX01_ZANCU|nr:NAD-dependent histone deacetylase HST3 [Zancudomyces culisetae]|eukprot:OMH85526.1 NAD-dependent histone deacetylase HST3 [Zancudomyces culisetae]